VKKTPLATPEAESTLRFGKGARLPARRRRAERASKDRRALKKQDEIYSRPLWE